MSLKTSPSKIKAKHSSASKVKAKSAPAKKVEFEDLGDMTVVMDVRGGSDRREGERRKKDAPVAIERRDVGERRAKVNRRRQIDPTTCERDYSNDELEFMGALDDYKRRNGRMFPTCSEILEVLKGIGYAKAVVVTDETNLAIDATLVAPIVELDAAACNGCETVF